MTGVYGLPASQAATREPEAAARCMRMVKVSSERQIIQQVCGSSCEPKALRVLRTCCSSDFSPTTLPAIRSLCPPTYLVSE